MFDSFIPPVGSDLEWLCHQERVPKEHPISAASARQVKHVLEGLESAKKRPGEEGQQNQVEFFQSLVDLVSPDAPAEGFSRNWPLVLDT